jgi:hypothetical protein
MLSAINAAIERPSSCAFLIMPLISSAYIFPRSLPGKSTSLYFPRYTSGEEACLGNRVAYWHNFSHGLSYQGKKYRLRVLGLKLRSQREGKNRNQNASKLDVFTVVRLRILFFWVMGNGFLKF